jgi:hypothetical protein
LVTFFQKIKDIFENHIDLDDLIDNDDPFSAMLFENLKLRKQVLHKNEQDRNKISSLQDEIEGWNQQTGKKRVKK